MPQPVTLLIMGECDDSKSMLINGLRDPDCSAETLCLGPPTGASQDLVLYRCRGLEGGMPLILIDTPRMAPHPAGDGAVTPIALIAMLESLLTRDAVPGGIHGIIMTTPISDCRIKLGAQAMQIIVDMGLISNAAGGDKHGNVILVGTRDRPDADEDGKFMEGTRGNKSIPELFFTRADPPGSGCIVMVHQGDCKPLLEAIQRLPAAVMEHLGAMRDSVAQQNAKHQALRKSMIEARGTHREEMAQSDQKMRALQKQMAKDVEDSRRKLLETCEGLRQLALQHREGMKQRDQKMLVHQQKMAKDAKDAEGCRRKLLENLEELSPEEQKSCRHELSMMQRRADLQREEQERQRAQILAMEEEAARLSAQRKAEQEALALQRSVGTFTLQPSLSCSSALRHLGSYVTVAGISSFW